MGVMAPRGLLVASILLLAPALRAQTAVAEGGKPKTTVVLAPGATAPERYAAEELAHWLGEMSGTAIPVRETGDAGENAIVVGQGALARTLAPDVDWDRVGGEETVVRTVGHRTLLAGGRPRGTVYAVFRTLDRLGCRWWTPWASTIPHRPNLTLPKLDLREKPTFESRDPFWYPGFDADWAARNGTNGGNTRLDERHGGKVVYAGGFVHTFYGLVPPDPYFRLHPEWFSLIDGKRTAENAQLCTTDPALRDFIVARVRERLRDDPHATIVSVSQNDCFRPCQCDRCQALVREQGSESAPVLALANYVAEKIEHDFPNVAVDTLAYQYTRKAPRTLRPRPNVIVRLCSIECNFGRPLTDPSNASFAADVRDWSRLTNRLYVWNYGTNFSAYPQPFPDLDNIGLNERFFAENGVKGIFEEGDGQSNGADLAEMRSWIESRLLWDPSQDEGKLIDEFLKGYYGAAAGPIRKAIDQLKDVPEARIYDPANRPYLSFDRMRRAEALWQEAARRVADDPDRLWRVRQGHLSVRYVWLVRWSEFRSQARSAGVPWPLPESRKRVADEWVATATGPGPVGWTPVTQVSEGGPTPAQWATRFAVDPVPPPPLPARALHSALPPGFDPRRTIDLQDGLARLANEPEWAALRGDSLASDGVAAWMPGSHHEWAVQMPLTTVAAGRYRVFVVVRVDRDASEGPAFSTGIYDEPASKAIVTQVISARDAGAGYRTFELGVFDLRPEAIVWVAPPARPGVRAVWVDRVLLVREP